MRHIPLSSLLLLLACGTALKAEDPVTPPPKPVPPTEVPPVAADGRFVLEFRGARLGQVLDYLSQQAGYVIANPVELPAPLTLVAKQLVTAQEAVEHSTGSCCCKVSQ